jgi:osmotically-inducible protein OsmY
VVTLKGTVPSDAKKARAESIAKAQAAGEVVANEIAVVPPGNESAAKTVNSDIDKAIDKNLDAALVQNRLNKAVKYSVKNGVVTLKGHVDSQAARSEAAHIAASVPNVTQVVNEVEVRHNRATSSR